MPTNKSTHIVVEVLDKFGNGSKTSETPNANPNEKVAKSDTDNIGDFRSEAQAAVINHAIEEAVSMLYSEGIHFYGKYTQLEENYIAQNAVSVASSAIGIASTMTSSIGAGAAIGGPIGAAVGAAIGAAKIGTNIMHMYENAYRELDEKAYSKYFYSSRYGLIDGNRGTEN